MTGNLKRQMSLSYMYIVGLDRKQKEVIEKKHRMAAAAERRRLLTQEAKQKRDLEEANAKVGW